MLQDFLDCGLLEIGDDDERLRLFEAAATTLAEKIKEDPISLIRYTAVAIDPNAPTQDAVFDDAEKAVKEQWKTYANAFSHRPTQILRAVLWQAISEVVSDPESGTIEAKAAVYLTAKNLIHHVKAGREQDVVKEFVVRMGEETEEAVSEDWAAQSTILATFPMPKIVTKVEPGKVDVKDLGVSLTNAAGPVSGGTVNPHYASHSPGPWNQAFGPAAAKPIAEAIDDATQEVVSNINKALESLSPGLNALAKSVQSTLQTHSTSTSYGQKKLGMLWWKEALYSPSLKVGYRSLTEGLALVAMAKDLHSTINSLHPASVEYFLRETVRAALGEAADRLISVHEFVEGFLQGVQSEDYHAHALGLTSEMTSGRDGFLPYISRLTMGTIDLEQSQGTLGIPLDTELPLCEFAVCVFRDMQARLVGEVD